MKIEVGCGRKRLPLISAHIEKAPLPLAKIGNESLSSKKRPTTKKKYSFGQALHIDRRKDGS